MAGVAFGCCRDMVRVLTACDYAIVATRARSNRLIVVKRHVDPGGGPMAVLAKVCRRQMIDRLARSRSTVMASKTVGSDVGMIETNDRGKCDSQVTALTLVTRRRVIDWLSRCHLIVMAACTLAINFIVIHALEWQKTAGRMTGVAAMRSYYMPNRVRGGSNDSALAMAILALAKGAGEIAAPVTIAASSCEMCAVKAETSRIVIEVRANYSLRKRRAGPQ